MLLLLLLLLLLVVVVVEGLVDGQAALVRRRLPLVRQDAAVGQSLHRGHGAVGQRAQPQDIVR